MTKNNKNFFKNKKHSGRGRKLFLPLCLAAAFLFIISAVIFIAYSNRDTETDPSVKPDTEEIPPLTEEPSVSDNDTEPEKPPVSYPKPEYNLTLEEIYVPLENISREYGRKYLQVKFEEV